MPSLLARAQALLSKLVALRTSAHAHKAAILVAVIVALHGIAVVWTDVPSEAITKVVSALLG